jgi:hypothetical protein
MSLVAEFAVEVVSAVLCFVLVRFMFKPYELTKEGRYLGLPLGFAFFGIAEVFLAIGIFESVNELRFLSLVIRTFAFVFLATTYYFSKEPSKNSRLFWDTAFSLLVVALTTLSLLAIRGSVIGIQVPTSLSVFLRVLALICISYISLHTLRSHIRAPEPTTIWIPLGFILLGISQYSLLIWAGDENYAYGIAFVGAMVARLVGLSVFIGVSYFSLHKKKNGSIDEKNSA